MWSTKPSERLKHFGGLVNFSILVYSGISTNRAWFVGFIWDQSIGPKPCKVLATKEYDKYTSLWVHESSAHKWSIRFLGYGDDGKETADLNLGSETERTRIWNKLNDLSSWRMKPGLVLDG